MGNPPMTSLVHSQTPRSLEKRFTFSSFQTRKRLRSRKKKISRSSSSSRVVCARELISPTIVRSRTRLCSCKPKPARKLSTLYQEPTFWPRRLLMIRSPVAPVPLVDPLATCHLLCVMEEREVLRAVTMPAEMMTPRPFVLATCP
uniref:Uncharacterized protein n=1 Tax=Cacopsylla melanoneura TaxID=428564 RepID=A0A8D8SEP7_9HEMI